MSAWASVLSIQLQLIEPFIYRKRLVFVEENKRCAEQKKNSWGGTGALLGYVRFCDLYHYDWILGETIFCRDSIVSKTNIPNVVYQLEGILENTLS